MDARYSRQLQAIGKKAQRELYSKRIGIIGLGALGSNVLNQIVRMGANNIVIVDRDIVELHNLHRCTLYEEFDVGNPKAYSAYLHIAKINNNIVCNYHIKDIYDDLSMIQNCDIVIECLDSIESRRLLDNFLKKHDIPWIHGAGIKNYGEVKIFNNKNCYSCFSKNKESDESCSVDGVHPSLTTMISSLQCLEAIKLLTNPKKDYDYLLRLNLENMSLRKIFLENMCECKKSTNKKNNIKMQSNKSCGKGVYRFKIKDDDFMILKRNIDISEELKEKSFYRHKNMVLTNDGRIIINAKDEITAESKINDFISKLM